MEKLNKIIFHILLIGLSVYPNFRIVKIEGGNLASLHNTSSILKEEIVKIKLYRDTCHVKCKFFIENVSNNEKLTIGFPNSLADYDMFRIFENKGIEYFKVAFDGKPISFKLVIDSTLSFGKFKDNEWFQFSVNVRKGTVHTIECEYRDRHYGMYNYLIGTGTTWNGPIRKGRITFDYSQICSDLFVEKSEILKAADLQFPLNLTPETFSDSIVYKFENYLPDSSEVVGISFYQYWTKDANKFNTESIVYDKISGLFFYGFKNDFLYRFLGDTLKYSHRMNFLRIREELFKRCNVNKNLIPATLSYGEKTAIEILTSNLDSLKNDIIKKMNRKYVYKIDTLFITDSCKDTISTTAIKKEIERTMSGYTIDLKEISPIADDFLIGKLNIRCNSETGSLIDTVFIIGNGQSNAEYYYPMIVEMIGLDKGRGIFGKSGCPKFINLHGKIIKN